MVIFYSHINKTVTNFLFQLTKTSEYLTKSLKVSEEGVLLNWPKCMTSSTSWFVHVAVMTHKEWTQLWLYASTIYWDLQQTSHIYILLTQCNVHGNNTNTPKSETLRPVSSKIQVLWVVMSKGKLPMFWKSVVASQLGSSSPKRVSTLLAQPEPEDDSPVILWATGNYVPVNML